MVYIHKRTSQIIATNKPEQSNTDRYNKQGLLLNELVRMQNPVCDRMKTIFKTRIFNENCLKVLQIIRFGIKNKKTAVRQLNLVCDRMFLKNQMCDVTKG